MGCEPTSRRAAGARDPIALTLRGAPRLHSNSRSELLHDACYDVVVDCADVDGDGDQEIVLGYSRPYQAILEVEPDNTDARDGIQYLKPEMGAAQPSATPVTSSSIRPGSRAPTARRPVVPASWPPPPTA